MFGFRKLDVYKCAVQALPLAYGLADRADSEMKRQLKRAVLSISLNVAEGTGRRGDDQRQFYRIARGSALECAAVLDAIVALGDVEQEETSALEELLMRIVAMLTKMSAG
ncbi:MAG: four helix bundle protein [Deltaproteobacteria bacterium]|nr:four helix bundle protein [Deltaproteobacteria bacterium]